MDILTFISNAIDSLAWPIFILAVLVIFREPIGGLIETIKNAQLKYKKGEMSLEVGIETLERRHPTLPKKSPSKEVNELVRSSPVKAIEKSWEELETSATAATSVAKPSSLIQIADMLIDKKLLSPSEAEAFHMMYEMKEEAIRPNSIFVTDVSSASAYSILASGLTDKIIGTANIVEQDDIANAVGHVGEKDDNEVK